MCISEYNETVFYLGTFLKKLADDQCPGINFSSITKGSICHIKYAQPIQPFTMGVD